MLCFLLFYGFTVNDVFFFALTIANAIMHQVFICFCFTQNRVLLLLSFWFYFHLNVIIFFLDRKNETNNDNNNSNRLFEISILFTHIRFFGFIFFFISLLL